MAEVGTVDKLPPGCTLVALPYVSKSGFVPGFVQSLVTAIMQKGLSMSKILWLGDHLTVGARNRACEHAIATGAEWLFFIDSDMDFPVETLARLKACNADIACTDMWARNWPSFRTVFRNLPPDSQGMVKSVPVSDDVAMQGVVDIDLCGMACTLIRTSLLVKMRDHFEGQPWFWVANHGEDATFCYKAKELGASIKCDFGIVAGHWGIARMIGQPYTRDANNQPMTLDDPELMKRMGALNVRA